MIQKLRICVRCGTIYWGMNKSCPRKCDFGSYNAIWIHDSFLKAFWYWMLQKITRKVNENNE